MYVSVAETLQRQPRAGALGWEVGMSSDSPSLGRLSPKPWTTILGGKQSHVPENLSQSIFLTSKSWPGSSPHWDKKPKVLSKTQKPCVTWSPLSLNCLMLSCVSFLLQPQQASFSTHLRTFAPALSHCSSVTSRRPSLISLFKTACMHTHTHKHALSTPSPFSPYY